MQFFYCVTFVVVMSGGLPAAPAAPAGSLEPRSLFHDVIKSFKVNTRQPVDLSKNYDNNLSVQLNYEIYKYGDDGANFNLPSDAEFIPRRNDRIEMPPIKYRIPKIIKETYEESVTTMHENPKEEVVLYIETTNDWVSSTNKPKKTTSKRPTAGSQKDKIKNTNKNKDVVDDEELVTDEAGSAPPAEDATPPSVHNTMAGQSHIGNRESQIVVKPTVIINFRGTIKHRDSDIRLEGRNNSDNSTKLDPTPQNVFNINQEIKLERTFDVDGRRVLKQKLNNDNEKVDQNTKEKNEMEKNINTEFNKKASYKIEGAFIVPMSNRNI